uniref:Uncharacterized protein n=1 Tax=Arundo donax TaxID=35708 RepID=A0A0A8ZB03_ARUDO
MMCVLVEESIRTDFNFLEFDLALQIHASCCGLLKRSQFRV